MTSRSVVLAKPVRTAIGTFGGSLKDVPAPARRNGNSTRGHARRDALKGDVSTLDELDRIFTQIKEDSGKLDIVFAIAGIVKYAALEITEETENSNGGSNE
jgi:NAD(P)-dependent dehydrogenase (short-subunit alcohol dehydrogenase family)